MAERRRGSIRVWQTGLFIIVIVVAILILSGSLSAGLKATLTRMTETNELRNASAFAKRLGPEFPLGAGGTAQIRRVIAEYRDVYGGGIWVYNDRGELLESAHDGSPLEGLLESARLGALGEEKSYVLSDLRSNGWIVAAKPLVGRDGAIQGVVVTASTADQPAAILDSVRNRLWVTFWTSLAAAGLLGLGFSEIIARRIRAMTVAAAAIEGGDFRQRVPATLVPDEIQNLAESYNSMAARLGEAFAALSESERKIATVVESLAEGVVSFDAAERILVANPEAVRLLGATGQVTGQSLAGVTDEADVLAAARKALAGEHAVETVCLGGYVVQLHCTPLLSGAGHIEGGVLLLGDVTERQRFEDAQRRFVADASHEMRTPIAAIKGMLELLADGAQDDPDTRRDFIETMQTEADRLGRLVSDLLTLARLEAGNLELRPTSEHATDLLGDVSRVMLALAEQSGVQLAVDAPEDLRVSADRDRIVQVLLSFTDNALKHSPEGSVITLQARRMPGGLARFEVTDEGPGIDDNEVERVFERFYRADSARKGGTGTGLGLAIAKELIEAHGATIIVESAPGAGTTFAFELPAL